MNNDNEGDRLVNMHTSTSAVDFFYCHIRIIICFSLLGRGRQEAPTYINIGQRCRSGQQAIGQRKRYGEQAKTRTKILCKFIEPTGHGYGVRTQYSKRAAKNQHARPTAQR